MAVVGLGGSGHDWSTCFVDGSRLVALDEERISRRKYGIGTDLLAAPGRRRVLEVVGMTAAPDHVVACTLVPQSYRHPYRHDLVEINHHVAHAYSTFFTSGWSDATIVVVDNAGSIVGPSRGGVVPVETVSVFRGRADADDPVELVDRVEGLHRSEGDGGHLDGSGRVSNSLGHFYRAVSLALGLGFQPTGARAPISEDGKTMGLASYGTDRMVDLFDDVVRADGLGVAIDPDRLDDVLRSWIGVDRAFRDRADLARAAQHALERALAQIVGSAVSATGQRRVCLAGGVALNSVANGHLLRSGFVEELHVVPAAGDNGISLGCALYGARVLEGRRGRDLPTFTDAYLGPPPDRTEVDRVVDRATRVGELDRLTVDDPVEFVASRLADGALVGWVEGSSEFGPRALGHRSIFSSPSSSHRRDHLNRFVKKREWFRPYAPIVTEDHAGKHFDLTQPSPYMLIVADVRGSDLPAITHVDGTARVQTLGEAQDPTVHRLLRTFGSLTGTEVLLNTSFNAAGEPIVESAEDAIAAYHNLGLDYLYLEGQVLARPERSGP